MDWASMLMCIALVGQPGSAGSGAVLVEPGWTESGRVVGVPGVVEPAIVFDAPPAVPYPYRLRGKYRYLFYRAEYYQGAYDYRRLFDYPWHARPAP